MVFSSSQSVARNRSCQSHRTGTLRLSLLALMAMVSVAFAAAAGAQSAVVFPNSISTIAGGGTTPASGAACATGSPFKATDAYGDGCPATLVGLGVDEWGIGADKFGNVFFLDNNGSNGIVHKFDAQRHHDSRCRRRCCGGLHRPGIWSWR